MLQYIKKVKKMARKLLRKGETPDQYQTELYDRITKIEVQVLQRIQKLKINGKSYTCQHFNFSSPQCEPYNPCVNYYDKFWKLFLLNEIGKHNTHHIKEQLNFFQKKLAKIDGLFEQRQKEIEPVVKCKRRGLDKSKEEQKYFCETCLRGYSDAQTLILHIKIKHRAQDEQRLKRQNSEKIYEENDDE